MQGVSGVCWWSAGSKVDASRCVLHGVWRVCWGVGRWVERRSVPCLPLVVGGEALAVVWCWWSGAWVAGVSGGLRGMLVPACRWWWVGAGCSVAAGSAVVRRPCGTLAAVFWVGCGCVGVVLAILAGACRVVCVGWVCGVGFDLWIVCASVLFLWWPSECGTRWMPWHQAPMKDVGGRDRPRGAANRRSEEH